MQLNFYFYKKYMLWLSKVLGLQNSEEIQKNFVQTVIINLLV